jgi:hypothetical protein
MHGEYAPSSSENSGPSAGAQNISFMMMALNNSDYIPVIMETTP